GIADTERKSRNPAQLTSKSTGTSSVASLHRASSESRSARSQTDASAPSEAASGVSRASSTSTNVSRSQRARSACASAAPMEPDAPVTSAWRTRRISAPPEGRRGSLGVEREPEHERVLTLCAPHRGAEQELRRDLAHLVVDVANHPRIFGKIVVEA